MDAVTILREIWRCRVAVGMVAVVAILVGFVLAYTVSLPPKSRKYEVGIASSRILVDTPDSQVVNVEPRGLDTLGVRASVLANVMTEGEIKTIIAREAGLSPSELRAGVEFGGELPEDLSSATGNPQAHLLTTRTAMDPDGVPLPIIEIEAQAPDPGASVRLANAAVAGLRSYLASQAINEEVPDARRLQVAGLGAPQVRQDTRGPRRLVALGVGAFIFLCGCAGILALSTLAPGWRLSTLAPDWRAKLVPGRWRAEKAPAYNDSKPTGDTEVIDAAKPSRRQRAEKAPAYNDSKPTGDTEVIDAAKPSRRRRAQKWRRRAEKAPAYKESKPTGDTEVIGAAKPSQRRRAAPG